MAVQFTEQQKNEYLEAFRVCDKDGDGNITADELATVFHNLGVHVTKQELQHMIREVDEDDDNCVDFNEFLILMAQKMTDGNVEEEYMDAFRVFDKDQDGYITREELREVMVKLGQKMSEEDIEEMIRQADTDKDGQINYDEFFKIMMAKKRAQGNEEHGHEEGSSKCCVIL